MRTVLAALIVAALLGPRAVLATECPDPLPQNPSGPEYTACLRSFQQQITQLERERGLSGIPAGAVMAFSLDECPSGWVRLHEAEGRFVVGLGNNDGQNKDPAGSTLTARHRGATGGFETHTLTIDEMPAHTHEHSIAKHVKRQRGDNGSAEVPGTTSTTQSAGKGKPHNNVPPFIALRYCQRSE